MADRVVRVFALVVVLALWGDVAGGRAMAADPTHNTPPEGFTALFDGETLEGWKALVGNPLTRAEMSDEELAQKQAEANEVLRRHWRVEEGEIINDGRGPYLCTAEDYGDFELWIDWKISPGTDSGIYLRGTPQVQIWDPVDGIAAAKVGSGGLYNNKRHPSKPLVRADRPTGEWNTFYIRMIGERVTVELNGQLVVDDVVMENYWDRDRPIFPTGQIELQTHGGETRFRNIYLRQIPAEEANAILQARNDEGFVDLFNGRNLDGWVGATNAYEAGEDGHLVNKEGGGGTMFTEKTYDNFVFRFEFILPPEANNGVAIRAPLEGNPAYAGMEIQILDDGAPRYARIKPWQAHGSVYGVAPAHRGYLRPSGEWNFEQITVNGSHVEVSLNGTVINEVDLAEIDEPMSGRDHPGIRRDSGHIGLMGYRDRMEFRNLRIKELGE